MIRNLLSNALKYTRRGKVLLGCRRRAGMLSIEVWDTGIGIPEAELQAIFEEYHQLDNAGARTEPRPRPRSFHRAASGEPAGSSGPRPLASGQGLGLRHRGRAAAGRNGDRSSDRPHESRTTQVVATRRRTGAILVVEDDPDVCELLELFLKDEGHRAATAPDGIAALELVARGTFRPDLILADYNLPNGMNGLQLAAKLRDKLAAPRSRSIILTGDISTGTLRDIARQDCVQLNKPVKLPELTQVIQRLLPTSRSADRAPASASCRSGRRAGAARRLRRR